MNIFFYRDEKTIPMVEWLNRLSKTDKKVLEKCYAQIQLLQEKGH